MGGKLSRALTRPFKNYNVEDRAQRVIARSQEVASPAPRYPNEAARHKEPLQEQQRENRGAGASAAAAAAAAGMPAAQAARAAGADLHAKHEGLNERLKGLYVQPVGESHPVAGSTGGAAAQRKLPDDRSKVADTECGYREPSAAPPRGRVTLKQALELISGHFVDRRQFDAEALAKQYNIETRQAQQLLRYFQSYNLAMPKGGAAESSTSSVGSRLPRQLEPPAQPKQPQV